MLAHLWLSTILLAMMAFVQASPADLTSALLERLRQFQAVTPKRSVSDVPLSSFPSQCQKGCSPAVTALNSCTSANCLCNEAIDSSLAGCIQCSLNTNPSASWALGAQNAIDSYNNLCKGNAQAPPITITISTGSSTGSATGNSSALSTFNIPLPTTTAATTGSSTTPTPTTITSLPTSLSSSAAKQGAHSNAGFGLIGVMITFLVPLLA